MRGSNIDAAALGRFNCTDLCPCGCHVPKKHEIRGREKVLHMGAVCGARPSRKGARESVGTGSRETLEPAGSRNVP